MKQTTILRRRLLGGAIHAVSWMLILGFPLVFVGRESSAVDWPQFARHSCVPLCYFLVFYANYLWLVPRFLFRSESCRYVVANVLLVGLVSLCLQLVLESLWGVPPVRPARGLPPRWLFMGRDLAMMVFVAGLGAAIRTSLRWRQAEERAIEAERQRTEAELKNLKNQLNPHFLLNTLNNIYALIAFDGERAQEAVGELGRLLRYVLYDNQQRFVPLARELDFIRDYVALMRIRLRPDVGLSVRLEPGEGGDGPLIAPLLFISLIENAFKHGVSAAEASFIDIDIEGRADGSVRCAIRNSCHPKSGADRSGSGVGLEQVGRRLELIYPGRYGWTRGAAEGVYSSVLIIQTKER